MSFSCFVCTTPYQLIVSAVIAISEKKQADLLIASQFDNAIEYAERIQDLNIFENVKLVKTEKIESYKKRKNKLLFGLGIIWNYLHVDRIVREILNNHNYEHLYISSQSNIARLLGIHFLKSGKEIIYFDDGDGSYYGCKNIYEAVGVDREIRKLLFGKKYINFSDKKQLYCPELYELVSGKSKTVFKVPNWYRDSTLLKNVNSICGWSGKLKINNKYILLDTIPSETLGNVDIYDRLIEICINSFGDELIIKKHPRSHRQFTKACTIYEYTNIPFEVICANSDMENKVLIGSISTACLMPILLLDIEPVVILLYKITGEKFIDKEKQQKVISYIQNRYKDKSKFMIPNTIDEFKTYIQLLKKKI